MKAHETSFCQTILLYIDHLGDTNLKQLIKQRDKLSQNQYKRDKTNIRERRRLGRRVNGNFLSERQRGISRGNPMKRRGQTIVQLPEGVVSKNITCTKS